MASFRLCVAYGDYLNDGNLFGVAGKGFVRLNFGTPRAQLTEGLERMQKALTAR